MEANKVRLRMTAEIMDNGMLFELAIKKGSILINNPDELRNTRIR